MIMMDVFHYKLTNAQKPVGLELTKKQKPNFYASFMRILTSNLLLSFPMGLSKALEDH